MLRKNKGMPKKIGSWPKSKESSGSVTRVSQPMRKKACLLYLLRLVTSVGMFILSMSELEDERVRFEMLYACFEVRSSAPANAQ